MTLTQVVLVRIQSELQKEDPKGAVSRLENGEAGETVWGFESAIFRKTINWCKMHSVPKGKGKTDESSMLIVFLWAIKL